jgi:hypothetical protein
LDITSTTGIAGFDMTKPMEALHHSFGYDLTI